MALFNDRLTELLKISQSALPGCCELPPAHHCPSFFYWGRNRISFYNEWSVPDLTPLCVWQTLGEYPWRFIDCRNPPSLSTIGLSNSIRSAITKSKHAHRFRELKVTKSRNVCLLIELCLHDHCKDAPENVLVGECRWIRMTLAGVPYYYLRYLKGLEVCAIFCFYMGSPVVLKAGLLRYTLLYLETPFSASRLPVEFFSCKWEFLKAGTRVCLVRWFL